jgi:hypothetical protein
MRGRHHRNPQEAGANWLRGHLDHCAEPLLSEPWILDVDTTVKPLYGHQEGAVVGYNPRKPGRPSHCYHTYSMAGTRLVLEVDVSAGDEHSSNHSAPGLWALLDRTRRDCWPSLLRGDKGFGNEGVMGEAERRALPYVFKLRLTANVKRAIERLSGQSDWVDSGQGWRAKETEIRLQGWSRQRRVVILRRRVRGALATRAMDEDRPPRLAFLHIGPSEEMWEYQVLATTLAEALESFGQLYRDRGDGENVFDELKNQWAGAASSRTTWRAVVWPPASWRCFMIGGTSSPLGRTGSSPRGDHEPTVVVARHRPTGAPCATNDDQDRQHARQVRSRRKGASSRRPIPKEVGHKCGAVDALAALARNPLPRLSSLPQRPRTARTAAPMSVLTQQPQIETPLTSSATISVNCRI